MENLSGKASQLQYQWFLLVIKHTLDRQYQVDYLGDVL